MRYLKDNKIESILRCPICKGNMSVDNNVNAVLCCNGAKKHSYDFSARGYINFAPPGHTNSGDSKQAVVARTDFLNLQLYRPVAVALRDAIRKHSKGDILVDAGCGEGYYSMLLAESGYSVFGIDLSKFAVDASAKRANMSNVENAFFAVSSVYNIPVADGSVNAVVNVFAPCVEEEYMRVLDDDGILAVAYAGPKHLMGLKKAIYKETHNNEEREDLPKNADLVEKIEVDFEIELESNADIKNLFAMTPYYWKTSKEDFEKLDNISSLKTEIDVIIAIYKKSN